MDLSRDCMATALHAFGFPLITEAHVERWVNDDTDLSAEDTLRQLAHLAKAAAQHTDSTCLAEALLAAESQQKALDSA
ncbi:hypothetical protein CIB48_g10878 [Xylaria polymorpha]|nr:hypothetical protein CIB48_g10878 [Xylaria polymorpha]